MIPIVIAIGLILIKGFMETFVDKEYSLLTVLWFCFVILFCVNICNFAYHKLKEITEQQIMGAVKDELV